MVVKSLAEKFCLAGSDFTGADIRNADFRYAMLEGSKFDDTTLWDQNTKFPNGFDPVKAGLTVKIEVARH